MTLVPRSGSSGPVYQRLFDLCHCHWDPLVSGLAYDLPKMSTLKTQVLIIGGGATGTGVARDLALRGVQCILVDQYDITAGASGANHGLLHSGGRYVSGDPESAIHCREEGELLKRLAPHCVEDTKGLFVAVEGDDERFIADFPGFCSRCGVPARLLHPNEARELEPLLSPKVIAAYEVEDATVDPFKLGLENIAQAKQLGTVLMTHSRVVGFEKSGRRVQAAHLVDIRTNEKIRIETDEVVNAAGAWSAEVARLADVFLRILYSKGTLLITQGRVSRRVVNRLRKPSDGDIIVPGGTVSVLGTTSARIDSLEEIKPTIPEVDSILEQVGALLPILEQSRILRAYAGVRPLVSSQPTGSDRSVSRDLALFDHAENGVDNFITITGGKLTTYRYMAEQASDLVCSHLGIAAPCVTRREPLPDSCAWIFPGASPRRWLTAGKPKDLLLCECELVPQSAVEDVARHMLEKNVPPSLRELGVRTRIGKGPCQGGFCSLRVLAHLYEQEECTSDQGLSDLKHFLQERWKGERPVLWGMQLGQAELKEAVHCGLLCLESVETIEAKRCSTQA